MTTGKADPAANSESKTPVSDTKPKKPVAASAETKTQPPVEPTKAVPAAAEPPKPTQAVAEPTTPPPVDTTKPAPAADAAKPAQAAAPAKAAQPATGPKRALVIDDEPANRDFLVRLLQQAKLEVHGAGNGEEGLKIAESVGAFALIVIDNKLPDMDGVDLLIKLREKYPAARLVMATMLDERALMAKAFDNGCNVFLVKPHGFMELFRRLQKSGPDDEELDRMIIDQYGLRPYRG